MSDNFMLAAWRLLKAAEHTVGVLGLEDSITTLEEATENLRREWEREALREEGVE